MSKTEINENYETDENIEDIIDIEDIDLSGIADPSEDKDTGKTGKKGPDEEKFREEMDRLMAMKEIQHMADFSQHNGNTTLQHVRNVAWVSFRMAKKLGWDIDEVSLARGAMLHDYYLYNIREEGISDYDHGIHHPLMALHNARKLKRLTRKEENIIRSHMWPLTLLHPPTSREALLVSMADKVCAVNEMFLNKKNQE